MKNEISLLEKLGQGFSIQQFNTADEMIVSSGMSKLLAAEINSNDQVCLVHPADDED